MSWPKKMIHTKTHKTNTKKHTKTIWFLGQKLEINVWQKMWVGGGILMKWLQNQCSLRIDSDMYGHRGISVFRGCVSYLWTVTIAVFVVTTIVRKNILALKRRSPPTNSRTGDEAHARAINKGQHIQQRRLSAWNIPLSRPSRIAKGRQVMYRLLPPTL